MSRTGRFYVRDPIYITTRPEQGATSSALNRRQIPDWSLRRNTVYCRRLLCMNIFISPGSKGLQKGSRLTASPPWAVAGEVGSVRSGTIKGLNGERRRLRYRGVPKIPVVRFWALRRGRSPLAKVLRGQGCGRNRVRNGSTSSLELVKGDGDALSVDAHQQRREFRSCLPANRRTIG